MRKAFVQPFVLIFTLGSVVFFAISAAEAQQPVQTQGGYTSAPNDESAWPKDLSGKVDKTIQVLTVIKNELDNMKESEQAAGSAASAATGTDADAGWVDSLKGKLSAVLRMWKKTDQIINAPAGSSAQPGGTAGSGEMTRELKTKIDKAVQAMEVIKQELDAVDNEPASQKK